jgi:NAD(P)-dependent dehydrogenase (short-subunit alcohol dehydrogenase family)
VACNDLDAAAARATAEAVGGLAVPFDAADPSAVAAGVAAAGTLGPVELLVANHAFMTMAPFEEVDRDDWQRTLDVNVLGTAWLLEAVVPVMVERGYGRVVALASEWGLTGWPNATAYVASKGAIVSLVRSAARALGPAGVAVNGVAPGVTDTPQLDVDARDAGLSHEGMVARYAADVPLGRIGQAADVAAVVAFLLSEPAGALVGQILSPNGGTTT